jgi:hypothetical protein
MVRTAIIMTALLAATPALAADQFDLICKSKSETIRYRVDLSAGEWCWEKCEGAHKIASITSTRVTFKEEDVPSGKSYAYVDRVTGKWWQFHQDRNSTSSNDGFCEPAPFTGFGAEKAKF